MEHRWFRKGFKKVKFYVEDDQVCSVEEGEQGAVEDIESFSDQSMSESDSDMAESQRRRAPVLHRPLSLNAFDLISFSPGFDLSGLFEEGGQGSRFVTSAPVSDIITKLEEIAKLVSFTVRKKDCRVCLEGSREGVKGPLTIAAEIFELTPSLVVVEIRKKSGDKGEYDEFYSRELKPGLDKLMLEISPASTPLQSKMAEQVESSAQNTQQASCLKHREILQQ